MLTMICVTPLLLTVVAEAVVAGKVGNFDATPVAEPKVGSFDASALPVIFDANENDCVVGGGFEKSGAFGVLLSSAVKQFVQCFT